MKKVIILALLMWLGMPFAANAHWVATANDDVSSGSTVATLIGSLNDTTSGVVFDCNPNTELVSIVTLDETSNTDDNLPVDFTVSVDGGVAATFNGILTRRNKEYVAVESQDADSIKRVLKLLRDATQKISVELHTKGNDNPITFTGNVSKSADAVNKFVTACDISL